jgi:hypothetical protein
MAGNKYLKVGTSGFPQEEASIQTSAGAGDAGKIPALDSSGLLDSSMMPVGVGADTASIVASENLAAGDFVNIWNDSGTIKVRKADASGGVAKKADGFVLAAVTSGNSATVYFEGKNTQLTSLTLGANYFLSGSVAGAPTATPPTTSAYIVQELGKAYSTTTITTEISMPLILA